MASGWLPENLTKSHERVHFWHSFLHIRNLQRFSFKVGKAIFFKKWLNIDLGLCQLITLYEIINENQDLLFECSVWLHLHHSKITPSTVCLRTARHKTQGDDTSLILTWICLFGAWEKVAKYSTKWWFIGDLLPWLYVKKHLKHKQRLKVSQDSFRFIYYARSIHGTFAYLPAYLPIHAWKITSSSSHSAIFGPWK